MVLLTILRLLPNEPTNLVASNVTTSGVTLDWSAVTGASGYNIYQDGVLIDSVTVNSYDVTSLDSATGYNFYVTAVDVQDNDANNESLPSNDVAVTTL